MSTLAKAEGKKSLSLQLFGTCKESKYLFYEDYHLLSVLKIIRNEEAHQLDVHKDKSKIVAVFISGLS